MVPLSYYLILSAILFTIGAIGVLIKKNPIIMFMCIELMLNAVNLTFIAFSRYLNLLNGQIFVLFIMTIAAAEVSIGLAIIITIFRGKKTIDVDEVNLMKE